VSGVKAASAVGGIGSVLALAIAAHMVSSHVSGARGVEAGFTLLAAVFAACWLLSSASILRRHPAPARRRSRGRDPETATPVALAEGQEPAQLAA
jgi:hypothetical protein